MIFEKDVGNHIFDIEQKIKNVKMMHSLGKISTPEAKQQIKGLEKELHMHLEKLPELKREYYLYRRECS